jgi:hypothetical protein
VHHPQLNGKRVATPNYGYEKRQKELAKKRKKEDKLRDKANRKSGAPGEGGDEQAPEGDAPANPAQPQQP